jgi:hypothetical protein
VSTVAALASAPPHVAPVEERDGSDATGEQATFAPPEIGTDVAQPFESVSLTERVELTDRSPLPVAGETTGDPASSDETEEPDEAGRPAYERSVQVIGVYSPRGFFNHPDARYCSRTGVKMGASQTIVLTQGPRPPLGVLTLDDGATMTIQWDTVIGREPGNDERVHREEAAPFLVSDDAQSVSRSHAILELVDWDVLISDLGSRNGTYIQLGPDESRRELAAGERVVLHSGTIVHLGDRSFVFHEHHVR